MFFDPKTLIKTKYRCHKQEIVELEKYYINTPSRKVSMKTRQTQQSQTVAIGCNYPIQSITAIKLDFQRF